MSYKVLSTIKHDGEVFEKDAVLEAHQISEEAAKALVDVKVLAPIVEGQVQSDAAEARQQGEALASEAEGDADTLEAQVQSDIQESLKQNEQLKKAPAEPVTKGSPSAEEIAAEAAKVK